MHRIFSSFVRPGRISSVISLFSRVLCIICIASVAFAKESTIATLTPYVKQGGYAIEIDGKVVRSKNLAKNFIPASTIKILTGLLALEILGPEYRFATHFFTDKDNVLYIQGEGDPFLTSEAIVEIAKQIKARGITSLSRIVLDDSAFALETPSPGSKNSHNPYDAQSNALAVNFNALPFVITKDRKVLSGEPQTPPLPLMSEFSQRFGKGRYRVNVSAFTDAMDNSNIIRYTGELFIAVFRDQGIHISGGFAHGRVPKTVSPLLLYESDKTVAELVQMCLYYSSNFIANQLYLSCGGRVFGSPATWKKARQAAQKYIHHRLQLKNDVILMEDGSGLSTNNRISPAAMLTILNRFTPYHQLLKKKQGTYLKSGTLTGVYSYAGYFENNNSLSPFVLLLNQKKNNRKRILKLMKHEFPKISAK